MPSEYDPIDLILSGGKGGGCLLNRANGLTVEWRGWLSLLQVFLKTQS